MTMAQAGAVQRDHGAIRGLQVLRFVAAAMVLFSHLNHLVLQRPALAAGFVPFNPVWWGGGVDVFFVISGFIMLHIAADQFGRPGAVWRFAQRRIVRLVPPYWLFTALALVAIMVVPGQLAHAHVTLVQVIASFLFVPVLGPDGKPTPVLILGWTLEFEMLFYAVFAIGLAFARRTGLIVMTAALVGLALLGLLQPLPMPLGFWANGIVIEFLFGMALALVYRAHWRIAPRVGAGLIVASVVLLIAVMAMGWPGVAWNWRFAWAGVPALLLCAGVVLVPQIAPPGLPTRIGVVLGDASYALYLSHPFTLSLVALAFAHAGRGGAWTYIAVAFVACVGVAVLLHVFIEQPAHAALAGYLAGERGPRRAPPATRNRQAAKV